MRCSNDEDRRLNFLTRRRIDSNFVRRWRRIEVPSNLGSLRVPLASDRQGIGQCEPPRNAGTGRLAIARWPVPPNASASLASASPAPLASTNQRMGFASQLHVANALSASRRHRNRGDRRDSARLLDAVEGVAAWACPDDRTGAWSCVRPPAEPFGVLDQRCQMVFNQL
jgi:hypothetical protein